ncbi:NUDIX hydrolase [Propionibacteriaceae bacterium Y2011]
MDQRDSTPRYRHEVVATVFRVRLPVTDTAVPAGLTVLAWQRRRDPYEGRWALPSGPVQPTESMAECITAILAAKVDLDQIAHLEQLDTRSDPDRDPFERTIATAYLGLVPVTEHPTLPAHADWLPVDRLPPMAFDHADIVASAMRRLRNKLSYTNLGFALAAPSFTMAELRQVYAVALGRDLDATNLHRVLTRRGQLEPTGRTRRAGREGGRPAQEFRFTSRTAEVTDQFAVLRPGRGSS